MDINTQQRPQQPQRSGGGDFLNAIPANVKTLGGWLLGILAIVTLMFFVVYFFGNTATGREIMFSNLKYLAIFLNILGAIGILLFIGMLMLSERPMSGTLITGIVVSFGAYFLYVNGLWAAVAWAIPYMKLIVNSTLKH